MCVGVLLACYVSATLSWEVSSYDYRMENVPPSQFLKILSMDLLVLGPHIYWFSLCCQYKSKITTPCIRVVEVVTPLSLSEGNTEAGTIFYRTSYQVPCYPIFGNWIQEQFWVPSASSVGPCWKLWSDVYETGIIEVEGDDERTSAAGKNDRGTWLVDPDDNELLWRQTVVWRPVQCCRERWWPFGSYRTRLWVLSAGFVLYQCCTRKHFGEVRFGEKKGGGIRRSYLVYKSRSQEWFPTVWHAPYGLALPSVLQWDRRTLYWYRVSLRQNE